MIDIVNIGPNGARVFELHFKKKQESFVRVHHPTCGHCKAMEKDLNDLEKDLESNYNGNIGVFNVHADALANTNIPAVQEINGYPTILAIKNGQPEQYGGNRSKDDMLKFCLNHLNLKKNSNIYTGGRKRRPYKKTKRRRTRKSKKSRKSHKKTRRR